MTRTAKSVDFMISCVDHMKRTLDIFMPDKEIDIEKLEQLISQIEQEEALQQKRKDEERAAKEFGKKKKPQRK